jgi:hypothetical protein
MTAKLLLALASDSRFRVSLDCMTGLGAFRATNRSYLTENTLRLRYKDQPVNVVYGNSRCFFREPYRAHEYVYTL